MKVSELIDKLTSINVNEREKYEGKEEYLNYKINFAQVHPQYRHHRYHTSMPAAVSEYIPH